MGAVSIDQEMLSLLSQQITLHHSTVAVDPYNYEKLVRTRQDDVSLLLYSLRKSNLYVFNRDECTANYNTNNYNIIDNNN